MGVGKERDGIEKWLIVLDIGVWASLHIEELHGHKEKIGGGVDQQWISQEAEVHRGLWGG